MLTSIRNRPLRLMAGQRWSYVTFDATGTLMNLAEPLGDTYLRILESVSGQRLSLSRAATVAAIVPHFLTEYKLLLNRKPNFRSDDDTNSAFPWWRELVLNVIESANVADCLGHNEELSERFARELYAYFATPESYTVFDDVRETLETLKKLNIPMGVISNFDERLEGLLIGLGLRDYFEVVTMSFFEPNQKPYASIFHSTFKKMQREGGDVDVTRFLHVGDHLSKDYMAARSMGAQARLVWRDSTCPPPSDVQDGELVTSLLEVLGDTSG